MLIEASPYCRADTPARLLLRVRCAGVFVPGLRRRARRSRMPELAADQASRNQARPLVRWEHGGEDWVDSVIEIRRAGKGDAKQVSAVILAALRESNVRDYRADDIERIASGFGPEELKGSSPLAGSSWLSLPE